MATIQDVKNSLFVCTSQNFVLCGTVSLRGIAFILAFLASVIYMLLLRLDLNKDSDNFYKAEKYRSVFDQFLLFGGGFFVWLVCFFFSEHLTCTYPL